jgi:tetratricopeptide (TPR) repeat protein
VNFEAGGHKKAKQLFRQALIDPTENVVAQVGWASRRDSGIEFPATLANGTPGAYEARAWSRLKSGLWSDAAQEAAEWLADEPFASRPAAFGSWVALTVLGDVQMALRFLEVGLAVNPQEPILLNNKAVALALKGDVESAARDLRTIALTSLKPDDRVGVTATEGLLRFRNGLPDQGRMLYRDAVDKASRQGNKLSMALALAHLAREEVRYNVHVAARVVSEVDEQIKSLTAPEKALVSRCLDVFGLTCPQ